MAQPNKRSCPKLRSRSSRAPDLNNLLNQLRALDRMVVETAMHIYQVPRRDRPAMLEQHRRLHDMVRDRLASLPLTRPRRA